MSMRLSSLSGLAGLLACGAAQAEIPQVAADITPVHSLVARVMAGLGEPALIVAPGSTPHGYSMSPSEAQGLQESDAVFWVGSELEPWLEDAIATLAPEAEVMELLDAPGTRTLAFRTGAIFAPRDHGGADGGTPDGGRDGEEHAHSHDGVDPHAWLDPENAKAWLGTIAATLGDLDPENAEAYVANAEAGRAEIDAAATEAAGLLAPLSDLRFVVFHDAYQYYEARFGLSAAGAIELGDATAPSPARIEEVRDTVRALDVACIFSEPQFNQGLVGTVAEGTEARRGTIDPMGAALAPGAGFYPQLITVIAGEIAACAE